MSNFAAWLLYDGRLTSEWANRSLSRTTLITSGIFEAAGPLLPDSLKARFLDSHEDDRDCVLFEDIFDHLNSIAPLNCFFGPHTGNASDFGLWTAPHDQELCTEHSDAEPDKSSTSDKELWTGTEIRGEYLRSTQST